MSRPPHRTDVSTPHGRRAARVSGPPPSALGLVVLAVAALALSPAAAAQTAGSAVARALWPEPVRAFFQDGPAFLLSAERRAELAALPPEARREAIEAFLARDPIPETPGNELLAGIERRRELVLAELSTFEDDRARLLFLHGRPAEREVIECATAFEPVEVWTYPAEAAPRLAPIEVRDPTLAAAAAAAGDGPPPPPRPVPTELVLYQPGGAQPLRLWVPLDSKRALYASEVEFWLEQWEGYTPQWRRQRRVDYVLCKKAAMLLDRVTGVAVLTDYRPGRPTGTELRAWLEPPEDLAAWARAAASTPLREPPPRLPVEQVRVDFPEAYRQRTIGRMLVVLPPGTGTPAPAEVSNKPQLRFELAGSLEQGDEVFETFKIRFRLPPPDEGVRPALVFERALRPDLPYLLRFTVRDEVSGAESRHVEGFEVPREPRPDPIEEGLAVARGEEGGSRGPVGPDSIVLLPPEGGVALGYWRAEALVSGRRIAKVVFKVDGAPQLIRAKPPYTVELRLAKFPTEQIVRAEGLDAEGNVVAADEIAINQPHGALRVRIVEPPRGAEVTGEVAARADVVVPEERRLEWVEFRLNDEPFATLEEPPWEARVTVPGGDEIAYLTVVAELDDGTRAEDVRFLNAPGFTEEVDVQLVELYVAVLDGSGRPMRGLERDDFTVVEEGREQTVQKFELMDALPLTLGIALDTSSSMGSSLSEAQEAATEFLRRVVGPRDRTFAVAFSSSAELLMPPTDDVDVVADAIASQRANGWTVLHDAVVMGLSYFRDLEGQQALVVLSDGDDTASAFSFDDALEYARRSDAAVYTIGLSISLIDSSLRNKLQRLAEETGGRAFFVDRAEELDGVYGQIEEELHSRYLLAYRPEPAAAPGSGFRRVEVRVDERGARTRSVRGYYP